MSNAAKPGIMDQVRRGVAPIATGRRWIESVILSFIGWLVRLAVVVSWALIVLIVLGILYWIAARMMGWPMHVRVAVNSQELMGVAIFVFCAAYALKART